MKKTISLLFTLFVLFGCKTDKKTDTGSPEKELTILEKVAYAHGFENWIKVKEIQFTFNVDRDTTHFERSWIWKVKANDVVAISGTDTLSYNRKNMDSIAQATNGGFINDKYWLMAPYNLIWDKDNITYEHQLNVAAPISKKPMQKLTIVYNGKGGYTPGDAYDFFFEDDFIVKEWIYRKGNSAEPSMKTTWEEYVVKNGLNISTVHKNGEGNFKLHFTDIAVEAN